MSSHLFKQATNWSVEVVLDLIGDEAAAQNVENERLTHNFAIGNAKKY